MNKERKIQNTFYTSDRNSWRSWLTNNYLKEKEIWLIFPMKKANEERLSYNDAVEEALCFGWIDSTIKNIDSLHRAQKFSPRKDNRYSRANIERLIWLESNNLLLDNIRNSVLSIIKEPYTFPKDIVDEIKKDSIAWINYNNFPEAYKRIRIAYVDSSRNRPLEFKRRLISFINKTRKNKMVGYGGIDKYYK